MRYAPLLFSPRFKLTSYLSQEDKGFNLAFIGGWEVGEGDREA